MDRQRRSRYLRALDIGVWTHRADLPEPGDVAASPESDGSMATRTMASAPDRAMVTRVRAAAAEAGPGVDAPSIPTVSAPEPPRDWSGDWGGLQQAVAGCTACKLCRTRNRTVFGVGGEHAPLMIVGEGPGADEDQQGLPFVGKAGKLLDEMLKSIGRARTTEAAAGAVYIANVVKCRPPQNRDPESDEVEACRPYLDAQIEHVRPKLIVALGRIAAQRLLSSNAPLSQLRGPQHEYGARRTPVLVSYHPAYLLRSPGEKAKSWSDLKRIHAFLKTP